MHAAKRVTPQQNPHQKSSAGLSLVAAACQRAIGVGQLLRKGVQGVRTPAFTPVFEAGKFVAATKGQALFDRHGVGCRLTSSQLAVPSWSMGDTLRVCNPS